MSSTFEEDARAVSTFITLFLLFFFSITYVLHTFKLIKDTLAFLLGGATMFVCIIVAVGIVEKLGYVRGE